MLIIGWKARVRFRLLRLTGVPHKKNDSVGRADPQSLTTSLSLFFPMWGPSHATGGLV